MSFSFYNDRVYPTAGEYANAYKMWNWLKNNASAYGGGYMDQWFSFSGLISYLKEPGRGWSPDQKWSNHITHELGTTWVDIVRLEYKLAYDRLMTVITGQPSTPQSVQAVENIKQAIAEMENIGGEWAMANIKGHAAILGTAKWVLEQAETRLGTKDGSPTALTNPEALPPVMKVFPTPPETWLTPVACAIADELHYSATAYDSEETVYNAFFRHQHRYVHSTLQIKPYQWSKELYKELCDILVMIVNPVEINNARQKRDMLVGEHLDIVIGHLGNMYKRFAWVGNRLEETDKTSANVRNELEKLKEKVKDLPTSTASELEELRAYVTQVKEHCDSEVATCINVSKSLAEALEELNNGVRLLMNEVREIKRSRLAPVLATLVPATPPSKKSPIVTAIEEAAPVVTQPTLPLPVEEPVETETKTEYKLPEEKVEVVVVGLLGQQVHAMQQKLSNRYEVTFLSTDTKPARLRSTCKDKNVAIMTGFMSHKTSDVIGQVAKRVIFANNGLSSLERELDAALLQPAA